MALSSHAHIPRCFQTHHIPISEMQPSLPPLEFHWTFLNVLSLHPPLAWIQYTNTIQNTAYSEGSFGTMYSMKDGILQTLEDPVSPKLPARATWQTVQPSHSQRGTLGQVWGKKGLRRSEKSDTRVCSLQFHSDSRSCQAFSPVISRRPSASRILLNHIVWDLGEQGHIVHVTVVAATLNHTLCTQNASW